MKIKLRKITEQNIQECLSLEVDSTQSEYIASNERSLIEAKENADIARPFAIYANDKMIGFTMFAWDKNNENPEDRYWLWRFMIDKSMQGNGYGHLALEEIIKYFRDNGADIVTLSTKECNKKALSLYHGFGFKENGEKNGDEIVLKLVIHEQENGKEFMIELPEQVKKALDVLEKSGYEAYIIGGCVRDAIMGTCPVDYDITTSALPAETESAFFGEKLIETGIAHGTVTVAFQGIPIEITTYRIDSEYSDNRHPDSVRFTKSLYEDAARRDFTMNAIAYNERDGIVDNFGGRDDIKCRIIRCVGDPDKRFKEDALRIMRALRFSSTLGFEIEEDTKQAIFINKELLLNVSRERIASELTKLLCGKNVREVLIGYVDVLAVVIPELLPMKGFDQQNPHHIFDILEHTAEAVENVPSEPSLRLAAMFHDIGKPECFSVDERGIGHFYGHSKVSERIADQSMKDLRFDNATRNLVKCLVSRHDMQIDLNEKAVKRAMCKLTPETFFKLIALKRADNLAQNPVYRDRQLYYDKLESIAEDVLASNECFSLKNLSVKGGDLIAIGMKPGHEIGEMLQYLLEAVINEKVKNEKSELLDMAAHRLKNLH